MAYAILGTPKPAFFDSSGSPLVSGTITTQDPADDSVKASYLTAADADASTNGTSGDITLDSRGEPSAQYWGRDGEDYKVIIRDSAGAEVYTLTDVRLPRQSRRPTITFTSTDATPSVAEGTHFITAGTTNITDFDGGQVGDIIHVSVGASAITIERTASILTRGGINFTMTDAGENITFAMFTDQVWTEIARNSSPSEIVAEANVILEGESPKIFFLNATTEFASTLPTPTPKGQEFTFIVAAAPSGADYTIATNSGANVMSGVLLDTVGELVYATGQDVITFVDGTSVIGDRVDLVSDGTNWYYKAFSGANGGITTGQT